MNNDVTYDFDLDQKGVIRAIYAVIDGNKLQLPYNADTEEFDEKDELVIQLREIEQANGNNLLERIKQKIVLPDLATAIAKKKELITQIAYDAQQDIIQEYSYAEQKTWDKKLAEARAITTTNDIEDADTLKAEAIAATQAETDEQILAATLAVAARIIQNSKDFMIRSATISGKRSRLKSELDKAKTLEELDNINWEEN